MVAKLLMHVCNNNNNNNNKDLLYKHKNSVNYYNVGTHLTLKL